MNLFTKTPTDGSHVVSCQGCNKNVFFNDAVTHGGTHWCMNCHSKGRHLEGHGFGPVRFSGKNHYNRP